MTYDQWKNANGWRLPKAALEMLARLMVGQTETLKPAELKPPNAHGGIRSEYDGNVCANVGCAGGSMPSTHGDVSIARKLWGAA